MTKTYTWKGQTYYSVSTILTKHPVPSLVAWAKAGVAKAVVTK